MTDENQTAQEGQINEESGKPEQLPGALLKLAREREGLSVDEVAKTLYMTRSKLCALENDEYEKLNSEVFVQGYLRKYAPIVGLDGDVLVDHYQKFVGQLKETVNAVDDSDEEIPNTLVPKFVIPAALFGIVGLVLITVFVFTGDEEISVVRPTLDQPLSSTNAKATDEELVSNEVVAESDIVGRALAERVEIVEEQAAINSAVEQPIVDSIALDEARNLAVISSSDNINPGSTPSALSETETGESELKFEFSEDCWIEVRDRIDAIIYTDIAKAGDSIELQGEPPFSISLGNAQAVTLYWGDEYINTQPRPGYRTAKLVVGD